MATFDKAIGTVLEHEGGYSFDPNDPGGETKYGISRKAYPGLDVKALTLDQAKAIYKRDYWIYSRIQDQDVATKVFDMAVNLGPPAAHRLLQTALNGPGGTVAVDGVFGPQTLAATNRVNPEQLLQELRAQAAVYYAQTVLTNPSEQKFLLGWMRRAVS
ncbi:MAG TPA: glycosyl hydrolase 108 family protein [bacterium]